MNTQANLNTLRNFIESRPGFNPDNYMGAPAAYRRDAYTARKQKQHALELLDLAERIGVDFEDTTDASQMLGMHRVRLVNGQVNYVVGQYAPTERRAQAARFIAAHIRAHLHAMGRNPETDSAVATLSRGARQYI